jgi:amino acid adenylation domain-containing protein
MNFQRSLILAPNQENILFAHKSAPNAFSYNVPLLFRLPSQINVQAMQERLNNLFFQTNCLFAHLCGDSEIPCFQPISSVLIDVVRVEFGSNEPNAKIFIEELCRRPFDLSSGPLFRVILVKYRDGISDLLLVGHHLVIDEQSSHLLLRAMLVDNSIQLRDYDHNAWAESWWNRLQSSKNEMQSARQDLTDGVLNIPLAWGCPSETKRDMSRRISTIFIAKKWKTLLGTLNQQIRISPHSLIIALVGLIVARRAKVKNPVIATVVSQRKSTLEYALGYLSNTALVTIPTEAEALTVIEFLAHTHQSCKKSYSRSFLPLIDIIDDSIFLEQIPVCVVSRSKRQIYKYVDSKGSWAEAQELPLPNFGMNQFPLNVYWTEDFNDDLNIDFYYSPSEISPSIAQDLADEICFTLDSLSDHLDKPLSSFTTLLPSQINYILSLSSGSDLKASKETLISRIEVIVREHPEKFAVRGEDRAYTYGQLWKASDCIAAMLQNRGVTSESVVAILLERNATLIPVIIGILKLGAAYLPLDIHAPSQRQAFMLRDSQASVLVTDRPVDDWVADIVIVDVEAALSCDIEFNSSLPTSPDSPAYIIYTSGSTGKPKGVPIAHRNVISLLDSISDVMLISTSDVWAFFHSVAFDFSVWEVFGCLCTGGYLIVVPHFIARSPEDFRELLMQESVTVLNQTPSAFSQLLPVDTEANNLLAVRYLIFGGEPLDTKLLEPWFHKYSPDQCRVVNMYGITETTVHCTYRQVRLEDTAIISRSVGRPLPGWNIYVLDESQRLVPVGVEGELYIGGAGVAGRYINRPDLTQKRFIKCPFRGGGYVYKSGDRGRYLPNGELEHLGRIDTQVKLRGFRIELDEIRSALLSFDGITGAAVIFDSAEGDQARACLRGYIVTVASIDIATIKKALCTQLPDYMVPTTLRVIDAIPLTQNGKTDVNALLALEVEDKLMAVLATTDNSLKADTLSVVANAWKEIFGVLPKETDNFFDLGGNSMLAARLKIKLERQNFSGIRLRELLANPTPLAMANFLLIQSAEG